MLKLIKFSFQNFEMLQTFERYCIYNIRI